MNESERHEKVIVLIQTDGMENDSMEYNAEDVKDMIKLQENDYNWQFTFLGANIDAVGTSSNLGINVNNAMKYAGNSKGMTSGFDSVSKNMTMYSSGVKCDMSYDSSDFDAQAKAGV